MSNHQKKKSFIFTSSHQAPFLKRSENLLMGTKKLSALLFYFLDKYCKFITLFKKLFFISLILELCKVTPIFQTIMTNSICKTILQNVVLVQINISKIFVVLTHYSSVENNFSIYIFIYQSVFSWL